MGETAFKIIIIVIMLIPALIQTYLTIKEEKDWEKKIKELEKEEENDKRW